MEDADEIRILWPNSKGKFSLKRCRTSCHGIKGCYAVSSDSKCGYSISQNGHLFIKINFYGTDEERKAASEKWIDTKATV